MLYVISRRNHEELAYKDGQEPIVHLVADLSRAVDWADKNGHRWAFTLSNAGSSYFEDRCRLDQLGEIDWGAVAARQWAGGNVSSMIKEKKQAEFLIEKSFPWELVKGIGVYSQRQGNEVMRLIAGAEYRPKIKVKRDWYY